MLGMTKGFDIFIMALKLFSLTVATLLFSRRLSEHQDLTQSVLMWSWRDIAIIKRNKEFKKFIAFNMHQCLKMFERIGLCANMSKHLWVVKTMTFLQFARILLGNTKFDVT